MDFHHALAGKYQACFDVALLGPRQCPDNAVLMAALLETLVTRLRFRRRAQEDPFGERRADGLAGKADRTVYEDKIFRFIGPEIDFLQFISTVRFDTGGKTAAHLDAIGTEAQHFCYIFTMQDPAGTDDRDVDGSADFRHDETARTVSSQMPACFCTFDDDGRSTQGLGYFS